MIPCWPGWFYQPHLDYWRDLGCLAWAVGTLVQGHINTLKQDVCGVGEGLDLVILIKICVHALRPRGTCLDLEGWGDRGGGGGDRVVS